MSIPVENHLQSHTTVTPDSEVTHDGNVSTAHQQQNMESILKTPQATSQVSGEVMLTPTHRTFTPQAHSANPHSSMTAITPMASAVSQAKSSIKLQ